MSLEPSGGFFPSIDQATVEFACLVRDNTRFSIYRFGIKARYRLPWGLSCDRTEVEALQYRLACYHSSIQMVGSPKDFGVAALPTPAPGDR